DLAEGSAAGVPKLDLCADALRELIGLGRCLEPSVSPIAEAGRCPTDSATGLILDGWDNDETVHDLGELARRGSTTPEDAAKCWAFVLRASVRGSETDVRVARQLANDPVFGAWATHIAVAD